MQCFPEIIPLFEAFIYLSQRFSTQRTSDRIRFIEDRKLEMSSERWKFFEQILSFQDELDGLTVDDELMERYFRPLKTSSTLPADRTITLGGMLLNIPSGFQYPFTYDRLIEYYQNAEQQDLLDAYYTGTLAPFYNDNSDLDVVNMSTIVASVNNLLIDAEDKWALIDCMTNPCDHLERLRPLVTKIIDSIAERSESFSEFIKEQMNAFCAKESFVRNLGELLRTEIKPKDVAGAEVYVSLFLFNSIQMSYAIGSFNFNRIFLGIYVNTVLELRSKNSSSGKYVQLLKMLSDQTRFNILHELCGRESYGQELADKFGGARSAIYYHLEKLLGYGLVDLQMTEYRMLYTMNKQNVYDRMNAVRDYLLDGWKPEPKQEKEEKEE